MSDINITNDRLRPEEDLYGKVLIDLTEREVWETRQDTFYQMRNHGLRRKNKPWSGAADMHFPLIDNTIRKLIPFYFSQFASQDVIADFVAGPDINDELLEKTSEIEQWFDYKIKEETNLEDDLMIMIDFMLQTGRGIMKTRWDPEKKRIEYSAIDPLYIIVPGYTRDLSSADRITEVIQLSTREYMSNPDFNQDPDLIKAISQYEAWSYFEKDDSRYDREGITRGHRDQIIIWNTYVKRKDGNYDVHYYSPNAPDRPVRPSFIMPYDHKEAPYTEFLHEKKEKRWYDSRGIAELLGVYELSATKMWNSKLDAMSYYNNPIYTIDGPGTGNLGNLNMRPGQVFPNNLRRVEHSGPAISWDEEIQRTQVVAEDTAQVPDFGIGSKSQSPYQQGDKRTATEVRAIGQMTNIGVDLKSRLFRRGLSKLYGQSWSLYQQYSEGIIDIMIERERVTVSQDHFEADYRIKPSGSPDSWDKDRQYQKALNRYQLLSGNPYTDQGKLTKQLMERDEVGLSKELYVDPQVQAANEAEDEAIEIGALLLHGHPAIVKPTDDHAVRIRVLYSKIISMDQNQELPTNPTGIQMINQHMQEHLAALQEQDPELAAAMQEEIASAFQQAMGDVVEMDSAVAEELPPEGGAAI